MVNSRGTILVAAQGGRQPAAQSADDTIMGQQLLTFRFPERLTAAYQHATVKAAQMLERFGDISIYDEHMINQVDARFAHSFRATWEDTPSSHAVPHSALASLGLTRGDFLDVKAWIFLVARKLHFENGERAAFKACEALSALVGNPACLSIIRKALTCAQSDDIPQILASCCLKLTAQLESQNNTADYEDFIKLMNLENSCSPSSLARVETTIFACLSSTEDFSFSRATALDILDLLLFAAFTCIATQSQTIQDGFLLDRPICVQLLAFLHCNSLIDCRLLALSVFIVAYSRQPATIRATIRNLLISLLGKDVVNLAEPIVAALKPRLLDDINDPRLSLRAYLVGMHGRANDSSMARIKAHLDPPT